MNLQIKSVYEDFFDRQKVERLNCEAFPKEERIETSELIALCEEGKIDLSAIYDGDCFVGFFTIFQREACAYLFFFAIDGSQRSKGYGSQVLKLIQSRYPECQLILDIEPLDENAENIEQRITRKKFYRRNGCKESGYLLKYLGMTFEVFYSGDTFNRDGFLALLDCVNQDIKSFENVEIQLERVKEEA